MINQWHILTFKNLTNPVYGKVRVKWVSICFLKGPLVVSWMKNQRGWGSQGIYGLWMIILFGLVIGAATSNVFKIGITNSYVSRTFIPINTTFTISKPPEEY